ncbi:hypothetical protein CCH79_00012705 [Gambusia affinis]|uniref:Alkylated DNA repair protein AlkB homologue 8 N-terminal domain-containing protein n=1 Tax=Gambusia affinis TaxID=33528 RepID=A0A315V117_GAMAF|nr:hypothetical protein CCH79_00012705 [Gambusia affinis]
MTAVFSSRRGSNGKPPDWKPFPKLSGLNRQSPAAAKNRKTLIDDTVCVVSGDNDGCISSRVAVPPHGVCDADGGTEEGGEAQEGDEDGGHLADSVRPAGGLAVHHHTALWEGRTQTQMIRGIRGQPQSHTKHKSSSSLRICTAGRRGVKRRPNLERRKRTTVTTVTALCVKNKTDIQPLTISGTCVERVPVFRFLGMELEDKLTWSTNTKELLKKAQRRLYCLRILKKNCLPSDLLQALYHCSIDSVLTYSLCVWYGSSTSSDNKVLQRVVRAAERTTGCLPPHHGTDLQAPQESYGHFK